MSKGRSYTKRMNDSFSKCLAEICGLELATLVGNYKYSVFGGHTFALEGHKGIVDYSCNLVSFKLDKSSYIRVTGSELLIKCLEKNFAVVVGKISGVEVTASEK